MLARRDSISPAMIAQLSARISERLFEVQEFENAETISTYLNTRSEVSTKQIVAWCIERGKRVIVPVTNRANRRLIFSELRAPDRELEPGTFRILEPKPEFLRPVPLEEAQVALVPGVAWDYRGYRIGYGGGYYDRTINSLRSHVLKIGLAYAFQIVNHIPTGRYDRRVDMLVTELRVITTRSSESEGA